MFNTYIVFKILAWPALILGIFLSGCGSVSELLREAPESEVVNVNYSLIYYIHADADYLYHDSKGIPVQGNSKVLETALRVAEEAKSGEIFIFYQSPERKFLGLFQRRSSSFHHYTNGKLTSHIKYRHSDKNENFLTTEARLYNQYRVHSGNEKQQNFFLYFGHEIPDDQGKKYHRTLPDIVVNTRTFMKGLQKFLVTDEQRFDLVVLSTCNNGSPAMALNLMPYSNILLASPQNLHLSHIDSDRLGLLESNPGIPSIQLAHSIANQTYQRLDSETQTTITLTVYDFEIVRERQNDLQAFSEQYDSIGSIQHFSDNVDCKQVAFFDDELFGQGLTIWYKPARFGRQSLNNTHSGWGCKPHIEDVRSM
jgi:hypothetical protein